MLKITRRNFDYMGSVMDYELENGVVFYSKEWNGDCYTVIEKAHGMTSEIPYYPIYKGIGEPDEDGDYERYEIIGFERLIRPESQLAN